MTKSKLETVTVQPVDCDLTLTSTNSMISDYTVDTVDISSITLDTNDTITIGTTGDYAFDTGIIDLTGSYNNINPDQVERMTKHYPGLEKVWRNFKHVYDMCNQDYKGKIESGEINEIDDEIPF